MTNKKGAMFGLDARIALAIFGALSVISGASLYSAIQNAKVTALNQSIVELDKAIEQYYLDTGEMLGQSGSVHGPHDALLIGDLLQNDRGLKGWNGPYIQEGFYNYGTNSSITTKLGELLISTEVDLNDSSDKTACISSSKSCIAKIEFLCGDPFNLSCGKYFDPLVAKYPSRYVKAVGGHYSYFTNIPFHIK
ncbi:MAG TPA: hypothetical protein DCL21_00295 [Alphaproteobacteria bacterium]|nr:hypothetical protein [Alphaproteobacteria bacterium]